MLYLQHDPNHEIENMSTTYEESLQVIGNLTGIEKRALAVELLLRSDDDKLPLQIPGEVRAQILRSKEDLITPMYPPQNLKSLIFLLKALNSMEI